MPYLLAERDTKSAEQMDDLHCNRNKLFNTYRQFSTINSMISGWKKIYRSRIKPLFSTPHQRYSLLDIGFGGGDIPLKLAKWAAHDHIALDITAIETDPRALQFVQSLPTPGNVKFIGCSSTEMIARNEQFDVVISNHLIHHLNAEKRQQFLAESQSLSKKLILFNDIERSDIAYMLFNIFSRPIFQQSFITEDGLTSIRRSFTRNELQQQTPNDWEVERLFPFRLLLHYTHD